MDNSSSSNTIGERLRERKQSIIIASGGGGGGASPLVKKQSGRKIIRAKRTLKAAVQGGGGDADDDKSKEKGLTSRRRNACSCTPPPKIVDNKGEDAATATIKEQTVAADDDDNDDGLLSSSSPTALNSTYVVIDDDDVFALTTRKEEFAQTTTSSRKNKKSKVVKVPNFASIHQKHFDSMEDIVEHQKRKNERAQCLLSGGGGSTKRIIDSTPKKPEKNELSSTAKNGRRAVRFTASTVYTPTKPSNYIPLPSTPCPMDFQQRRENKKLKTLIDSTITPNKSVAVAPPATTFIQKPGYNRFGFYVGRSVPSTRLKPEPVLAAVLEVMTRGGKKEPVVAVAGTRKITKKTDAITEVRTKMSTRAGKKNTVEKRRDVIKGVRSNRRFDLMMALRGK